MPRDLDPSIPRCDGHISTTRTAFGLMEFGRAECVRCARRAAARTPHTTLINPPALHLNERCQHRIAPAP